MRPKNLMLDSGAFSAWNSGKAIDIDALITESRKPRWNEAVSLDVIGDGWGSKKNAVYMKTRRSPAFPVFHIGEEWELFDFYCQNFPKVGISCRFGEPVKVSMKWVERCFNRCYPHPFHSFGWTNEEVLKTFPFHSADSISWHASPNMYGNWKAYGHGCSVRGGPNLKAEVLTWLKLERYLKARWKKELSRWPETIRTTLPMPQGTSGVKRLGPPSR